MNIKLTAITAGILVGISSAASAQTIPQSLTPPIEYSNGPLTPGANTTDISSSEEAAFALFEGILQVTEAKVHADQRNGSCGVFNVPVSINTNSSADGATVSGTLSAGGINLTAVVAPASNQGRGQAVSVTGGGQLNGVPIPSYSSSYVYNGNDDMLVSNYSNTLVIENGAAIGYSGSVIKDFLPGVSTAAAPLDAYNIYDWGLQAVSKLGYPVEKWWQRSISHRSDGTNGRTIFIKDRLVGDIPCRIVLETNGLNDRQDFIQGGGANPGYNFGRLTVSQAKPGDAVVAVDPENISAGATEIWSQSPFNGF